jgi:hypothetical protein
MAVANEWDKVNEAFNRLDHYRVLQPTLAAMRKLVEMVQHDSAFGDVHPMVSMASLVLSRGHSERRVAVAWGEDGGYKVALVNSQLEFSEPTMVRENAVVKVLQEYLDRLDGA